MLLSLDDFVRDQSSVYAKFDAAVGKMKVEGLSPSATSENRDGYLLVLRHPESIAEQAADFSRRVAEVVPSMCYRAQNIHTTVLIWGMQHRSLEMQTYEPGLVDAMATAMYSCVHELQSISLQYIGWKCNKDSVIAKGIAREDFVGLVNKVWNSFERAADTYRKQQNNYTRIRETCKKPWGGHITIARFLEKMPPEALGELFSLVQHEPGLGESKPLYLDIAYVTVDKGKINLETKERFKLR